MYRTKDIYVYNQKKCKEMITVLNEKLVKMRDKLEKYKKFILEDDTAWKSKIILDDLRLLGHKYPYSHLISKLQYENVTDVIYIVCSKYTKLREKELNTVKLIKYYERLNIPYNVYKDILDTHNLEVCNSLLHGEHYTFTGVGTFYITTYNRKNSRCKVNWKESYEILEAIAKEKDIESYNLYKKKYMSRNELTNRLKPYLYNKDTGKGIKWLVQYTDDLISIAVWNKFNPYFLNKKFYEFVPVNYVHNKTRSQIDFANNAKSKEEIIYTTKLGFRDKINVLNRFDPNHYLCYKKEIKTNV